MAFFGLRILQRFFEPYQVFDPPSDIVPGAGTEEWIPFVCPITRILRKGGQVPEVLRNSRVFQAIQRFPDGILKCVPTE
jgi:hypothetical protein